MGLIKEPLNVDFYVEGRQMTDEDQNRVSEFIARQKTRKKRQLSAIVKADTHLLRKTVV